MLRNIWKITLAVVFAATVLLGCLDKPDELVGVWNASSPASGAVMAFLGDGTGTISAPSRPDRPFKWQRVDGKTPDGYQGSLRLSNPDGTTDVIVCAFKIERDTLAYANCELHGGIFKRADT